jgi:hypothetical protein
LEACDARVEVDMPEIHDTYTDKDRSFGGKMGSKKTVWLTVVFVVAALAVGTYYMVPQFW